MIKHGASPESIENEGGIYYATGKDIQHLIATAYGKDGNETARKLVRSFKAGGIDEVHAFVAPKLIGGENARSPIGGDGFEKIPGLANLRNMRALTIGNDLLIQGDVFSCE